MYLQNKFLVNIVFWDSELVGKLATRYIGPYRVMQHVGEVAYRLELPSYMALHPVFHVSVLKRHIRDPTDVEPKRVENLRSNLTYPEGPFRIGERRIRKLKNREIPRVQIFWGKQCRVVVTWEDEERFWKMMKIRWVKHQTTKNSGRILLRGGECNNPL